MGIVEFLRRNFRWLGVAVLSTVLVIRFACAFPTPPPGVKIYRDTQEVRINFHPNDYIGVGNDTFGVGIAILCRLKDDQVVAPAMRVIKYGWGGAWWEGRMGWEMVETCTGLPEGSLRHVPSEPAAKSIVLLLSFQTPSGTGWLWKVYEVPYEQVCSEKSIDVPWSRTLPNATGDGVYEDEKLFDKVDLARRYIEAN